MTKSQEQSTVEQQHLKYRDRVNLGGYYTKPDLVSRAYELIRKNVSSFKKYTLIDTSCGYGSFFQETNLPPHKIGADVDEIAIKKASGSHPSTSFFCHNSLFNVSRKKYQLSSQDKIIIVGNPPYNDATSIIRKSLKQSVKNVDGDLKVRDLGISFLLSYNKLQADYICALHPLSYLIKKSNFALLEPFVSRYKLIDAIVISSAEFSETSKTTSFPIVIALYQRSSEGMNYDFIKHHPFQTKEGASFKIASFDSISRYLSKYPNQRYIDQQDVVAKFWTMRDINALKRSRTFIQETTANAVFVTSEKLDYYCYVDIFKKYINHVPYYFGNCDVMINNKEFLKIKDSFRFLSLKQHPYIKAPIPKIKNLDNSLGVINAYFRNLLGEHYVY